MTNANQTINDAGVEGRHRWALPTLIAVFCMSLLAVWLVPGNTAGAQNRSPFAFLALSAASVADKETFEAIDAALRDRLGAQATVSTVLADVSVDTLKRSPTASVFLGSDHQPFYAEDLTLPCNETEESLASVKAGLLASHSAMDAADKYLLYMVAPNKTSIHRAAVEDVNPDLLRCSDFVQSHYESWEADGSLPLVTLWDDVAALNTKETPAYLWNDTHWTTSGSMALSRALMNRLVTDREVPASILDDMKNPVYSNPVQSVGDLGRMMGVQDIDLVRSTSFNRPGVDTKSETTMEVAATLNRYHFTSTSDAQPLVPGRTLLIGDSFLLSQMPTQLSNFFEDVTMTHMDQSAEAGEYDRVIAVRVQRYTGTSWWPSLTPDLK